MISDRDTLEIILRSIRGPCRHPNPAATTNLYSGRVGDVRPVTAQALLFSLPNELLRKVFSYLDTRDIKSLALVHRDCRQLARSRLFASVVLDYSREKCQLLVELCREARAVNCNGGVNDKSSIGICIRQLTVRADPEGFKRRHGISRYRHLSAAPRAKQEEVLEYYYGTYIPAIAEALQFSMPDLRSLKWQEIMGVIPQRLFTIIASLDIRELRLINFALGPDCEYPVQPLKPLQGWALTSLDLLPELEEYDSLGCHHDHSHLARFFGIILGEAAPVLERLSCDSRVFPEDTVIQFPRLRVLVLRVDTEVSDSVMRSLVPTEGRGCALRSISIGGWFPVGKWKYLARRGHIRGLEALRLCGIEPDHEITITEFLAANPQLKSLQINSTQSGVLPSDIPPFFSLNLGYLTTLVITIWSEKIRLPILEAIGRLSTLTSLWIAAGTFYRVWGWITDTSPSIAALSPLRNLTRFALTEGYYAGKFPLDPQIKLTQTRNWGTGYPKLLQGWEDSHRKKVREVVKECVAAVRSLRWVYTGQLVHTVVGDEIVLQAGGRRVLHPSEEWGVE